MRPRLVLTLLLLAGTAEAAVPAAARLHLGRGFALVTRGEHRAAIHEFLTGYRIAPLPNFLFNIALAYETLSAGGDPDDLIQAQRFYGRYLQERPAAPDRAAVQARIRFLAGKLAAATAAAADLDAARSGSTPALPQRSIPPTVSPIAAQALTPGTMAVVASAPDPAAVSAAAPRTPAQAAPPPAMAALSLLPGPTAHPEPTRVGPSTGIPGARPDRRPLKRWHWGLIAAVGAVIVAGSITTGVVAAIPRNAPMPASDFGNFPITF